MRSFFIGGCLLLAMCSGSLAAEVNLHKHPLEEVKSACEKVGVSLSQDAGGYGCGTDCKGAKGTDCTVFCDTKQNCTAQVIGSRRPKTILDALQAKARR